MSTIIFDMSMSLDGFVSAAGPTPDGPMGVDGERLHEWVFPPLDERSGELLRTSTDRLGAMITGRTTYDESVRWWGPNGPSGEARAPIVVATTRTDPPPPEDSVYLFVNGVDSVVHRAREAARGKDIAVSGVETGRLLIRAGYVDELWIHVVPVLFGDGKRLYEVTGVEHRDLHLLEAEPTPDALHLRYRVGAVRSVP